MKRQLMLIATLAMLALTACEKTPEPEPTGDTLGQNLLVLNEGVWGGNNASLTRIGADGVDPDWFSTVNHRGLGDVAQDLVLHDNHAYITVWGSGSLEAISLPDGHSTRVDLGKRGPRYMAIDGGKLYITCYNPHSVVRVDLATLEVEAECLLGGYNPEGIAAVGGRLYVASDNIADSNGLYRYDNLLYVVDQATFRVVDSIVVGVNPQKVLRVDDQTLVVNYLGQWNTTTYATEGEGSAVVDLATHTVRPTGQALTNMTVAGGTIYGYVRSYESQGPATRYVAIDPQTLDVSTILPGCTVDQPYAIDVSADRQHFYIASDGERIVDGDLYSYRPDGTLEGRSEVGMLPSKVVQY